MRPLVPVVAILWALSLWTHAAPRAEQQAGAAGANREHTLFRTADTCFACHNSLTTPAGADISIGTDWRGSIMANSSRDPYWQAAVRREVIDHPKVSAEIEDECATCHMPMARTQAAAAGKKGQVFGHLPIGAGATPQDLLAHDGVSCTMCHQISAEKLGTRASFTGGFAVDTVLAHGGRPVFGPFQIDRGRTTIMQSASGFRPTEGMHVRQSEMCATCHTLYTKARGPGGAVAGELAEQVPYLEWRHSEFPAAGQSCQTCHMPVVREDAPIASVLGTPRQGVARHVFQGGNFFILRMLNRYREALGVESLPRELEAAARSTIEQLQSHTATVAVDDVSVSDGRLNADVVVHNLGGHKLPTGYPSRRVWIHFTVRDARGALVFESGGSTAGGAIAGNNADRDAARFEPHYTTIREASEVQIYESIMADAAGNVTTGLLSAVRYVKDNRLLPRGFDKQSAHADIAVVGDAVEDRDFTGGRDRIRYSVDLKMAAAPYQIAVALKFQPIGFRWARNLDPYEAVETRRFVSYFDSMAAEATEILARTALSR